MFQKEKNQSTLDKSTPNSATLISAGTTLQGDVQSNNDLRIDGTVHGNIRCSSKIIVGPSGFVEGNIEGVQADITGRVTGNITVKEVLQLRAQSNVQGNLSAVTLQIDPSATFNGQCKMGTVENKTNTSGSVVLMETDVTAKAK
ncbi:MAG TPA: polymer-forming cytoskeletal protein [Flavisolibacter sp.]